MYGIGIKEGTKILLHDQTVYIFIYYVDLHMMYVNCELGNNKK
jgi:hypothetical protein